MTTGEQQWNTTFNSMMDGVALLDTNGVVLRLNDSLLRVCNLDDPGEALGRHCYELLYGDSEALREGPIERVLSSGQRIVVERDIAATGISLRESIDPIFDDQLQIVGLVLVVRDVTRERDASMASRSVSPLPRVNRADTAACATRGLASPSISNSAGTLAMSLMRASASHARARTSASRTSRCASAS